jgi:putative nucleotidyltransferase with HDIG domain
MKEAITRTLKLISSALRNLSLYPPTHPAISQPIQKSHESILDLFKQREPLVMGIIDDVLLFDEVPYYETDTVWKELHSRIKEHRIESITFSGGLELREMKALISLLALPPEKSQEQGTASSLLEKEGVSHITIKDLEEDLRERAREVYDRSVTVVFDIMSELRMGRIPSCEAANAVISDMTDVILRDKNALLALTMLKSYDDYTYLHSINVGILCLAFAAHEGFRGEEMHAIGLAGMLHDVGKVRTAEEIIKKPGNLTEEEMLVMKKHPVLGAEIISRMQGVSRDTHEMVLMHHVKYNLEGYPTLEKGREVHPYSMAITLVLRRLDHAPPLPEAEAPRGSHQTDAKAGRKGPRSRDARPLRRHAGDLPGGHLRSPGHQRDRGDHQTQHARRLAPQAEDRDRRQGFPAGRTRGGGSRRQRGRPRRRTKGGGGQRQSPALRDRSGEVPLRRASARGEIQTARKARAVVSFGSGI